MSHFFAIPLPPVRETVAALAEEWRRTLPPGVQARWYAPEDYHITVKFLGAVDSARLPELVHAAWTVAATVRPFSVHLAAPGGFPDLHRPFVLWCGVRPDAALSALAAATDLAMARHGFSPERRPYRPHVTLARCRTFARPPSVPPPPLSEQMFPAWRSESLALVQTMPPESRRNGPKARYNTVHLFPLGTPHSSAE